MTHTRVYTHTLSDIDRDDEDGKIIVEIPIALLRVDVLETFLGYRTSK